MVNCGTLIVQPSFDPSAVEVASCPNPPEMAPGQTTQITVDVSNGNTQDANTTIILAARPDGGSNEDSIILSETTATIPSGGDSRRVTLDAPDTGEYELLAYTANVSEATAMVATQRVPGTPIDVDRGTLATAGAGLGALTGGYLKARR